MRFNKLIYIRYMPLTAKIFADFYMDEAIKNGIDVEYWDITRLFFNNNSDIEDSSSLISSKKICSYKQLENLLILESVNPKTLFISIMTFEGRVGKLYRMLTKYKCTLAVFGRNMFPVLSAKNLSIFERLRSINMAKIFNYINTLKVKKQKLQGVIKKYDIIFMGGELGWQGVGNIDYNEVSNAEIVKLNSDDYDNFLRLRNVEPLISGDYILFLDEYLPLHPDTVLFGINTVSPEQYYPELCKYFDKVEKLYSMPVIIAAHPKALRYKDEDFFEGRKLYFGKSGELSKYASFVIAHGSTSINYPIAFEKKLHFITSRNIEKEINTVHKRVILFANYLRCNYEWFDKNDDRIDLIEIVSEECYNSYKYRFQTWPETENTFSSEIFLNFLKK